MAEVNRTFYIKQGDLLPLLEGRIFDPETGEGQDLDGATLAFHMKDIETGELLVEGAATAQTPQSDPDVRGWWTYEWQAGDTGPYSDPSVDETVIFKGEVQATIGGKPLTAPNKTHFTIKMRNQLN